MNILKSKVFDKENCPKDIAIIRKMFDSLGIEEYEKNTLNYMSEFINSYIVDILKESKKNMGLAGREKINIEDVELAVKKKQNLMYQSKPSFSKTKALADKVNSKSLPQIPENQNLIIPPNEINLLKNNFQLYSDELNQILINEQNKNIIESTSLRPDDLNMLSNKRKVHGNESSKKKLSNIKKQRKLSLKIKKKKEEKKDKQKIMNDDKSSNDSNNMNDNDDIFNNDNDNNNSENKEDDEQKMDNEEEFGEENDEPQGEDDEEMERENEIESNNVGSNEGFSEKAENKNKNNDDFNIGIHAQGENEDEDFDDD